MATRRLNPQPRVSQSRVKSDSGFAQNSGIEARLAAHCSCAWKPLSPFHTCVHAARTRRTPLQRRGSLMPPDIKYVAGCAPQTVCVQANRSQGTMVSESCSCRLQPMARPKIFILHFISHFVLCSWGSKGGEVGLGRALPRKRFWVL